MEEFRMKTVSLIIKIVVALAAIAGIVYLVATYGNTIVAWAKKMLSRFGCCCCGECDCECECDCDCQCCCDEEEVEDTAVAAEQDFEG